MIYTPMTKKAMQLAYQKHDGQLDKLGIPYIFHPIHVAEQMDDEDSTILALLHDVIEDTDASIEDLTKIGFKSEIIDSLRILTKPEALDYFDYINIINNNKLAKKVKIADLKHNLDKSRLDKLTEKDYIRIDKYKKALEILQEKKESSIKKQMK